MSLKRKKKSCKPQKTQVSSIISSGSAHLYLSKLSVWKWNQAVESVPFNNTSVSVLTRKRVLGRGEITK